MTITSILDKILEILMQKRLIKFLDDQHILYPEQFGFRKKL